MEEVGIDISKEKSKLAADLRGEVFDCAVTRCGHANKVRSFVPGQAKVIRAGFGDPPMLAKEIKTEEEPLSHCQRARNGTKEFVSDFPGEPYE